MPARLTTQTLIEKFIKVHGNRYTYDETVYENQWARVVITCRQHGNFTQTPNQHLRGFNCPLCAAVKAGRSRTGSFDNWLSKANRIHDFKYQYKPPTKFKSTGMITMICPDHGEFSQVAYDHVRGVGCPMCSTSGFNRLSKGYLYVLISNDFSLVKVGITGNVKKRMRRLSYDTPFHFHLIAAYESTGKDVERLEKFVHKKFESAGMNGFDGSTEWLNTENQIEEILNEISKSEFVKPVDVLSWVFSSARELPTT